MSIVYQNRFVLFVRYIAGFPYVQKIIANRRSKMHRMDVLRSKIIGMRLRLLVLPNQY